VSRHIELSLEEVQAKLPEIVHGLREGDEVILLEGERPVARLLGPLPTKRRPRTPGSARGRLTVLAEDEDHLTDFGNYRFSATRNFRAP
jgi:antitoxin (DNA-binding transcriptional repressor) of toxin-antitoxin stability system